MSEIFSAAGAPDPEITESLLKALREAGADGATASALRLETGKSERDGTASGSRATPRRTALFALIEGGRVIPPSGKRGGRYALKEAVPDMESVGAKLLALTSGAPGEPPVLWRKRGLASLLSASERPLTDATLARIEERRGLLRVADGSRDGRFLFATPLRRWLGLADAPPPQTSSDGLDPSADDHSVLLTAYTRAVRESGGFPDVKISALQRLLPFAAASALPERLRALWREGQVTLSLGDWSLADEEMRKAAVELAGERYLLVRFEEDLPTEEFST